jgi:[ribosomal protein S5]-alanine N-acetyltransferase
MVFARTRSSPSSYSAHGTTVGIRPLVMTDYPAWSSLRDKSRDHLTPYEPTWASDELSKSAYRRRLRHYAREEREDQGYAFAIFELTTNQLVGGVSLSNVRRGVTQTASLGYWMGLPHVKQGFMREAVGLTVSVAFDGLRLHRLEAATLLDNTGSIRVLEHNGFQREGLARRYLRINGDWRDHLLFGLLAEDRGRTELFPERQTELAQS